MFPFDLSKVPKVPTRRALLVVDAQNDFLAPDGALPISEPAGLPEQIVKLVEAFRPHGDIIWVRTEFERHRPDKSEAITLAASPTSSAQPRGRRPGRNTAPVADGKSFSSVEAFLNTGGPPRPQCVRKDTPGAQLHPALAAVVAKTDHQNVKTHYSAFKGQLINLLRIRMVSTVYICGALTNIGIQASAMDAATYGHEITLVEDCCGYRDAARHDSAIDQIELTTGCEIMSLEEVIESFQPGISTRSERAIKPDTRSAEQSTDRRARPGDNVEESSLGSMLADLKLSDDGNANQPRQPSQAKPENPMKQGRLKIEGEALEADSVGVPSVTGLDESESNPAALAPAPSKAQHDSNDKGNREKLLDNSNNSAERNLSMRIRNEGDGIAANSGPAAFGSIKSSADSGKGAHSSNNTDSNSAARRCSLYDSSSDEEVEGNSPLKSAEMVAPTNAPVADAPAIGEPLCEGDTRVITNVLPPPLSENIFERIRDEVKWQRMSHQGGEVPRLVAVQGEVAEDGSMPVYRHPADESPPLFQFTPAVREIKDVIEKHLGHPLNHVLIQFYRDGNDYISEHSDKTLDIAKGSYIANVSLGAERTMVLRTKRPPKHAKDGEDVAPAPGPSPEDLKRQVQRAPLAHNSLFQMGLQTNMRWLHGIRQDKRREAEKSEAERAFAGGRISLTFRQIGTFLDAESTRIWGQGAKAKTREEAHEVINGQTPEAVRMLQAFGRENQTTEFDWNEWYGAGFDVLHISAAPRLFLSSDTAVNTRIQMMLAEYEVSYARGSMSPSFNWKDVKATEQAAPPPAEAPIKFVDTDADKSTVQGELGIMLYLDRVYGGKLSGSAAVPGDMAKQLTRFQQGLSLLEKYRAGPSADALNKELDIWDGYVLGEDGFVAGQNISLADFAVWPALHEIVQGTTGALDKFEHLKAYYERVKERPAVVKVLSTAGSK